MRKSALLGTMAGIIMLTGCSSDEHKGETCVQSHEEHYMIPVYIGSINGIPQYTYVDDTRTVCDKWVKKSV